jgi:hypothetical protein
MFEKKLDGLTPDVYKVVIIQALIAVGEEQKANFRRTNIGALPNGSTLRPQNFFQLRISGLPRTTKLNGVDYTIPGSSAKRTVNIFQNSQQEIYEMVEQRMLDAQKYTKLGNPYIANPGQENPVKVQDVLLNDFLLPGNWMERKVDPYSPMVKGENGSTHLQATVLDRTTGKYRMEDAVSERLTYFVHVDEDNEVVFSREYKNRVKPFLLEPAKAHSPEEVHTEPETVPGETPAETGEGTPENKTEPAADTAGTGTGG